VQYPCSENDIQCGSGHLLFMRTKLAYFGPNPFDKWDKTNEK
jgi:hypothetical protein